MLKNLIYDQWLSQVIGKNAYKLIVDNHLLNKPESFQNTVRSLIKNKIFIYSKIPSDALNSVHFIQESGFKLIDTAVKFQKYKSDQKVPFNLNDYSVRFTNPLDQDRVVSIAINNFKYSRFHIDPCFKNATADEIKGKWAENYYKGHRGNYMVVTEFNNQVTGFLLLLKNTDKLLTIDLIAVAKEYQGQKMASNMILFAESHLDFIEMHVSTQIVNIPSVRLYEKLGFRMHSAEYVFHYHN